MPKTRAQDTSDPPMRYAARDLDEDTSLTGVRFYEYFHATEALLALERLHWHRQQLEIVHGVLAARGEQTECPIP